MNLTILATTLMLLGGTDGKTVKVSATLPADTLEVGKSYEFLVDVEFPKGVSPGDAGIPAALLQVQVPPSAKLTGEVLTEHKDLARNEFLQAPFERTVEEYPARIAFKLTKKPAEGEAFHLNVMAYTLKKSKKSAKFLRRRLALPLKPGATAKEVEATPSDWGGDKHLQLGDKAEDFDLPSADDTTASLAQFRGKKNVIVTTYRAHW